MPVGEPDRGQNTATPLNIAYRVGRVAPYISGRWLDFGCAEGGYSQALLDHGADEVIGVDVEADRIEAAKARGILSASFQAFDGSRLDFENNLFDGAFVNEVLEHVTDEQTSLREILRVLKPGGHLALISPNRWFPIEGHIVNIGSRSFGPAPLIPWLPEPITRKWTKARNYWPSQLADHVRQAGFAVLDMGFIWPVLEQYPWLPPKAVAFYQRHFRQWDDIPGLRRFGLSTLVIGVKPARLPSTRNSPRISGRWHSSTISAVHSRDSDGEQFHRCDDRLTAEFSRPRPVFFAVSRPRKVVLHRQEQYSL
jgi:2-polyprenyl-3-methyl-5-hydroxy-6-metoxy-1,4-benzoquinol methylase